MHRGKWTLAWSGPTRLGEESLCRWRAEQGLGASWTYDQEHELFRLHAIVRALLPAMPHDVWRVLRDFIGTHHTAVAPTYRGLQWTCDEWWRPRIGNIGELEWNTGGPTDDWNEEVDGLAVERGRDIFMRVIAGEDLFLEPWNNGDWDRDEPHTAWWRDEIYFQWREDPGWYFDPNGAGDWCCKGAAAIGCVGCMSTCALELAWEHRADAWAYVLELRRRRALDLVVRLDRWFEYRESVRQSIDWGVNLHIHDFQYARAYTARDTGELLVMCVRKDGDTCGSGDDVARLADLCGLLDDEDLPHGLAHRLGHRAYRWLEWVVECSGDGHEWVWPFMFTAP